MARTAAAPRTAPTDATNRNAQLGLTVQPVDAEFARDANLDAADRGLRVLEVQPAGPARNLIAPRGTDVITDVLYPAKRKLRTVADLQAALAGMKPGDVVSLRVYGTAEPIGPRVVNLRIAE